MPDAIVNTQSLSEGFDAAKFTSTVDTVDPKVLESMAAKSGQSIEDIKKALNIADGKPAIQASGTLLAGKFKSEGELQVGIGNIVDKLGVDKAQANKIIDALGPEEAYKHFQSKLGTKASVKDDLAVEPKDDLSVDGDGSADASTDADKAAADQAAADKAAAEQAAAEDVAKAAGVDFQAASQEFVENGELSPETMSKLSKVVPQEYINSYLQGISAQQELMAIRVHDAVGGSETWDTLVEWAKTGLSEPEKVKFNQAINLGNTEAGVSMAKALKSRFEASEGSMTRQRLDGGTSNPNAVQGYQSKAEMTQDMKDPRYKNGDMAFHALVQQKMKHSKFMQ